MSRRIIVLIEDDWELMGNGLGNVEKHQHQPCLFLFKLARELGLKFTFMVETMQQLSFRAARGKNPELSAPAALWEETVRMMVKEGHDVQLHLHPQWLHAHFKSGYFHLSKNWNIATFAAEERQKMLQEGIQLLSEMVRPLDSRWEIHSFKAGSWGLQPSEGILRDLINSGIQIVMGPGKGIVYRSHDFEADYSRLEESLHPYHPHFQDVCRVSPQKTPLWVLPLPWYQLGLGDILQKVREKRLKARLAPRNLPLEETSVPSSVLENSPMKPSRGKWASLIGARTFDVGNAPFGELKNGLDQILARYFARSEENIPLVIQSHTKCYPGNEKDLALFYQYLASRKQDGLEFQTLSGYRSMVLPS